MHFDCESDARHPFPKSIRNRSFWSKSMKNTRSRVHRMQSGHTSLGTCGYTQPNRQPNRTLRFFLSCDDRQANMQIAMNTQFKRMFGGNGRKRFALRFSSADKNRIAWDCRLTRQLIYLRYEANAFKYTGRTFVSCDIGMELEGCGGEIGPAKIWDARGIISINGRPFAEEKAHRWELGLGWFRCYPKCIRLCITFTRQPASNNNHGQALHWTSF